MKQLLLTVLLLTAAPLAAQEFTTDAAKAAKAAYEADLKAAREKYAEALTEAAKTAVDAGELDEVVRIKAAKEELSGTESERSLARIQSALEGSKWTWTSKISGRNSSGLQLLPDQKIFLSGVNIGAWQMVEPRTLIMRGNDGIWILYFNHDYTEYTRLANFRPNPKHNILPGRRTSPPRSTDIFKVRKDPDAN